MGKKRYRVMNLVKSLKRSAPPLRTSSFTPNVNVKPKPKKPDVNPKKPDVNKPDVKPKKPVSKKALAAGAAGVAVVGVAAAVVIGADQRRRCVDEWRKGYPEQWEENEESTLKALLQKTKTGDADAVAKYQKAYDALYDCDKHAVVGNGIAGIGKGVGDLVADTAGKLFGPIAEALGPVKWVLIALLCALAVGAAYKAYTVLLARREAPAPVAY